MMARVTLADDTSSELTLVVNGMNLLQINASWQPLATGLIVLIAVAIDMRTRRLNE